MAEVTYTKIATVTVTATNGASSIDFTNIPQNYTHLVLKMSLRTVYDQQTNPDGSGIIINNHIIGDSSVYTAGRQLYGTGTSQGTGTLGSNAYIGVVNGTGTYTGLYTAVDTTITNYSSSSMYKTIMSDTAMEDFNTAAYMHLTSTGYNSYNPVTRLSIVPGGWPNVAQVWDTYSSVTLYGVNSAIKATGGTISVSGGYVYHTFTSSGTFTPTRPILAEMLVLAGGGPGGISNGGGGGAGGLLNLTAQAMGASPYTVLVGAGGQCNYYWGATGYNGNNSEVVGFSPAIGGGAGSGGTGIGNSGGSGGGGGGDGTNGNTYAGGSGTASQGYAGGTGAYRYAGGGGGGAGGLGGNVVAGNPGTAGNGGVGSNTYSTWATATGTGSSGYYAGGGGGATSSAGGTGGTGGGTAGSSGTTTTSAAANTGSGAGGTYGGGSTAQPGFGGSGLVIIRYAV